MADPTYSALHDAACERGDFTYKDPQTGYIVFTRMGLLERDKCCGAGCRHCPFGHESVSLSTRALKIQQAAWLSDARPDAAKDATLLFWSGGKDSYLAYRVLAREADANIVLLTTFDARSRIIAHQEFPIDDVVTQAAHLGLPLIGVPLHAGLNYIENIAPAFDMIPNCNRIAFGDLHLQHIRSWRQEAFAANPRTAQMTLSFPLWNADYRSLLTDLTASGAASIVSAVSAELPQVSVGDRFDAALIRRLPKGVDPFGENGEFHTRIVFSDVEDRPNCGQPGKALPV